MRRASSLELMRPSYATSKKRAKLFSILARHYGRSHTRRSG
ncbi:hypothetical protein N136_00917 [Leifsonia aquatica ATCC 14665]|uniref:Uncharacterized protein n=1 Tax=Leifsonia aquatica ATCC 14665 TaxID=1358026 RepID=U2RV99_LEIAQ|nr:hypothetical protein N136_00917 [Leifsonia aquatica ATCC 14665]